MMRRGFVDRRLQEARTAPSSRADAPLKLADLSLVPRWGLKGRGVAAWLAQHSATMPSSDNCAERQQDGSLITRLSPTEVLLLASSDGRAALAETIGRIPPEGEDACYPVPRQDSHCWFAATGDDAANMLAKLCAVDLAPDRFPCGQVAQTSVARLSSIVIRNDMNDALSFFLLADSASAEYLWDCLLDAMGEFGGVMTP